MKMFTRLAAMMGLLGCVMAVGFVSAKGRALSERELARTFGAVCLDCNTQTERTCSGATECPGCGSSSVATAACGSATIFTNNSYWVTINGGDDNWGVTTQDYKVDCYQEHRCNEDGSSMPNMTCGPNGNCQSGTGNCIECTTGGTIDSMHQYWSYYCAG